MTPDAANAAKRLFSSASDVRDAQVFAAHSAGVFELLARHFSRLVGELGMRTLFARSLALSSPAFPCLRAAIPSPSENPHQALRHCLEHEAPEAAMEAAVHVFQTFVQLLERFIGAALVASLLHEVWPAIFPAAAVKESK